MVRVTCLRDKKRLMVRSTRRRENAWNRLKILETILTVICAKLQQNGWNLVDWVALLITDIKYKSASFRDKCSLDPSASFVTNPSGAFNSVSSDKKRMMLRSTRRRQKNCKWPKDKKYKSAVWI